MQLPKFFRRLFGIKDAAPKVKLNMVKPCYGARPVPYDQSLLARVVDSEPERYNSGNSDYSGNSGSPGSTDIFDGADCSGWSTGDLSYGDDSGNSDNSSDSGSTFDFGGGDAGGGGSSSDW